MALIIAATLSATSVFAASGLERLIAMPQVKAAADNKAVNGKFTDFTGSWVGTCTNGDSNTLTIKNTQDSITMDGENKVIGKLESTSETTAKYSHLTQTLFHWNADGSQLILNIGVEDQSFDDEIRDNYFFVGKSILSLSNGQLIMDSTYQSLVDRTNIVCTYKKQ